MSGPANSTFPLPAFQRPPMVRNPINRSQPMPRRKAPSRKSPFMVYCESAQEEEALLRFEASPSVLTVRSQSRKVSYQLAGKERHSTPDFELGLDDGQTVLVEIKNSTQAKRPDVAQRLVAIANAAQQQGHPYHVVTEQWIRFQPVLENLRLLSRWRSTATVSGYQPVLDDLRDALPMPFREAAQRLGGQAITAAYVLANRLHMNLLEKVDQSSPVFAEPHSATATILELPWQSQQGRQISGGAQ
ncbi:MAG: TnsA endonuclease N-terminal domain-containing protein [Propionivibrio sp.]